MDGVQGQESITGFEGDADDNEVVNMIKVFTETLFSDIRMNATYDQVSGRANSNLVRNMARQYELAIIPSELQLHPSVSHKKLKLLVDFTDPFAMDVDVVPPHIIHEILCSRPLDEGHASTAFGGAQENVQDRPTPDDIDYILMRCTV